jgi:hypothetical protein
MDILKHEIGFKLNEFQQQEILSINESIAQIIINMFLMRQGNLPGLPHIGLNIRDYLNRHEDEIDAEDLKAKIMSQCHELIPGLITNNINVYTSLDNNNRTVLIISIGLTDKSENDLVYFGFRKDADGRINYLFEFEKLI